MNYFLKKNEKLFEKEHFKIEYEIDSLPYLKEDISVCLNKINCAHKYKVEYDEEKNTISQNIENQNYILGVDYIGPSSYYAKKRGIEEKVIILLCVITREIGGHIVFPTDRHLANEQEKSLNEIRSYRFKERIDYFLFELKQWYLGKNEVKASKNIFNGNKKWFMQFNNFKGYIDFFLLNDFVDENYDVYDLSSYDNSSHSYKSRISEQPYIEYSGNYTKDLERAYIPQNYSIYIRGCVFAIKNRTKRINNMLESDFIDKTTHLEEK